MIKITDWKSKMGLEIDESFHESQYDVAFVGDGIFDDRIDWVNEHVNRYSNKVISVSYIEEQASLKINEELIHLSKLKDFKVEEARILIETTSLRVAELIYLFEILESNGLNFSLLYVQPDEYNKKRKSELGTTNMFDLSEDGKNSIRPLTKYNFTTERATVVIALGFEGHRFGYLLQDENYEGCEYFGVIGVPAFKAGWENRTLSNNADTIKDAKRSNAEYCIAGANDPIQTYKVISKIFKSLDIDNDPFESPKYLLLAPFGTKPMSVAMALFAKNNSGVGVIYDFLKKKHKRSTGQAMVHLWNCQLNSD